jgi:hypothetical protein
MEINVRGRGGSGMDNTTLKNDEQQVLAKSGQYLPLMKCPPCYIYIQEVVVTTMRKHK